MVLTTNLKVKSSEKYRDADTNKQQEYDNAITAAKAILNKQHGPKHCAKCS